MFSGKRRLRQRAYSVSLRAHSPRSPSFPRRRQLPLAMAQWLASTPQRFASGWGDDRSRRLAAALCQRNQRRQPAVPNLCQLRQDVSVEQATARTLQTRVDLDMTEAQHAAICLARLFTTTPSALASNLRDGYLDQRQRDGIAGDFAETVPPSAHQFK